MPTAADIIVRRPTEAEKAECKGWPIWECEAKTFDWSYTQQETCLIIQGRVTIKDGKNSVSFVAGDYVVFPRDLDCTWQVEEAVKKYYDFS